MDEPRAPNLEEMDEKQAHQFLNELFFNLSAEEEYVMEVPQSGESIRGREKMRAFQEAYPTIQLRRMVVREGLCR